MMFMSKARVPTAVRWGIGWAAIVVVAFAGITFAPRWLILGAAVIAVPFTALAWRRGR